jgi:raffinose/stachyose/melibiose transport system substrate-binding protein
MKIRIRSYVYCLLVVMLVLAMVGCRPATPPPEVTTQPPATTEPTQPPVEPVTLKMWYLSGSPQEMDIITAVTQEYMDTHPGVTIELSFYGFEDYQKTLKLAMDSGAGPDLFYGDWGTGVLSFANAGLLVDLNAAAEQYGWGEKLGTPLPWSWYWDAHAPGHTYGIAYDYAAVGVYYNKTIFTELGLVPPTTFEEFQTILATIKAERPDIATIAVGGGDGWPLSHPFEQILHGTVPYEELKKIALFPGAGGDMSLPGYVEAAQIFQDWGNKGYFQENFLAASNDDMVNMFIAGTAAIMIAGTWNSGALSTITDFEVGFFGTPPVHTDINPDGAWHLGGFSINNPWCVNAASIHQSETLELLDYMFGKDVATALWTGMADTVAYAFAEGEAPAPIYPFQADIYNTMQVAQEGFYIGIPGYESQWSGLVQSIATGAMTPEEFGAEIASLYARALSENQP